METTLGLLSCTIPRQPNMYVENSLLLNKFDHRFLEYGITGQAGLTRNQIVRGTLNCVYTVNS